MSKQVERRQYTELFGPTTGDAVRLGDTDLFAVVEHDKTVYGDESVSVAARSSGTGWGRPRARLGRQTSPTR